MSHSNGIKLTLVYTNARVISGRLLLPKNNVDGPIRYATAVQTLQSGGTTMKNSATAQECALNSCKSINMISGLGLKVTQRVDKKIELLFGNNRNVDSWDSWEEARIALWSTFLIVEAAYLKNVLLGDSALVKRRLAEAELKLAETTTELKSVQADRDHLLLTAVRFARLVDLDK